MQEIRNEWIINRIEVICISAREERCDWDGMRQVRLRFYEDKEGTEYGMSTSVIVPNDWSAQTLLVFVAKSVVDNKGIISINQSQGSTDINNILKEYCTVLDPVDLSKHSIYKSRVCGRYSLLEYNEENEED